MQRELVDSSNIRSIGYDDESQTLEVEFLNGSIYQYFDVPKPIHTAIMGADSKGKYFSGNIKGTFRYSKV